MTPVSYNGDFRVASKQRKTLWRDNKTDHLHSPLRCCAISLLTMGTLRNKNEALNT